MNQIILRGVTWNHSRALPPLVATAQRFEELHPGVRIQWEKRTLHEFGHADIITLAQTFDLLVIDHPMVGDAEAEGVLTDLHPILSSEELKDLQEDSVGPSFSSYLYHDKLYALPIDAAAPAASFRPDLLDQYGLKEPQIWADVVSLAHLGLVRMPAFSADLFLNFMGLCVSLGSPIACNSEQLVEPDIGARCLELLRELAALMPDDAYDLNPIALYERMSTEDSIAYCPFAYTYSNYSRNGFGKKHIRFANPVGIDRNTLMRTVVGGTGIAISESCKHTSLALEYSLFIASQTCQRTLYGICGGQPARQSAWDDPLLNQLTDEFFLRTSVSIRTAYVRPRYRGYVVLQERAGQAIAEYCRQHGNTQSALQRIDALYRSSIERGQRV
jgi:multiple sugar transport system substrate-binding protein